MVDGFNKKLCDERHDFIVTSFEKISSRLDRVEDRFLVIMTTLVITLVGVIANLVMQMLK